MPVFILWNRKCDSGEDVVNRPITVFASCVPLAWLCRIVTKFGRRTQARKRACVAAQGALACLASLRVCVKSEYKSHLRCAPSVVPPSLLVRQSVISGGGNLSHLTCRENRGRSRDSRKGKTNTQTYTHSPMPTDWHVTMMLWDWESYCGSDWWLALLLQHWKNRIESFLLSFYSVQWNLAAILKVHNINTNSISSRERCIIYT